MKTKVTHTNTNEPKENHPDLLDNSRVVITMIKQLEGNIKSFVK